MPATDTGLLRAVLVNPSDDVPRLIYADWLEEHGETERAEFIRVQIKLARINRAGSEPPFYRFPEQEAKLRHRKSELWHAHSREWFVREDWSMSAALDGFRGPVGSCLGIVRRGFVAEIHCTLADWLAHGPAIVAAHPIERVEVTDKTPIQDGAGAFWQWATSRAHASHWGLPLEFHDLLSGTKRNPDDWWFNYVTRNDAVADLSRVALSWARAQAGLPPLDFA